MKHEELFRGRAALIVVYCAHGRKRHEARYLVQAGEEGDSRRREQPGAGVQRRGRDARVRRVGEGRAHPHGGRTRADGLVLQLGRDDPRPRARGDFAGRRRAREAGYHVRHRDAGRGDVRRAARLARPGPRHGARRELRHRGRDDGRAARARRDGPEDHSQVRRLLPRPFRRDARQERLGRARRPRPASRAARWRTRLWPRTTTSRPWSARSRSAGRRSPP